ncbi:MAG: LamG domain-containing protein [Fibrobacterales bacterium]
MKVCAISILAGLSFVVLGCSLNDSSTTSGTYIETTNGVAGVAGVVRGSDSEEVYGAQVRLRSKGYLVPPLAASSFEKYDTETDRVGYFAIGSVGPGEYVLEIVTEDALGKAREIVITDKDSFVAVNEIVSPLGRVNGAIAPSRMSDNPAQIWVQVYGFERLIAVDSLGRFATALPEGAYRFRVVYGDSTRIGFDYSTVTVTAGGVVNLDTLGSILLGGVVSSSSTLSVDVSSSIVEELSSSAVFSSVAEVDLPVPDYMKEFGGVLDGNGLLNFGDETQEFDPLDSGFTVHFSFSYSQTGIQYLVMKGNTFSSEAGWSFFIDVDDKIYWRINPFDNDEYKAAMNFQLTEEMLYKIHTVTGVVDRETQELRGYINGSSTGWKKGGGGVSGSSIAQFPSVTTTENITVGGSLHSKDEPGSGLFSGYFGAVSIFKRTLTVEEIELLENEYFF